MLTKRASKNQVTIPKAVLQAVVENRLLRGFHTKWKDHPYTFSTPASGNRQGQTRIAGFN